MIWTSRRLLDLAMSPIALYPYIRYRGYMDNESVIVALGALAQATRLDAFRLLVRHEPEGLPAGEVAKALDVSQNTKSVHLATLARDRKSVVEGKGVSVRVGVVGRSRKQKTKS